MRLHSDLGTNLARDLEEISEGRQHEFSSRHSEVALAPERRGDRNQNCGTSRLLPQVIALMATTPTVLSWQGRYYYVAIGAK